jgi:phosphonate transport system substrate-binding protein
MHNLLNCLRLAGLTLLILGLAACYKPASESHPLGSEQNPLVMYFVPSTEAEKVLQSGEQLGQLLSEKTGLHFRTEMATSYEAIVAAMGVGKVHIGWLPPMAYLFAQQRNGDRVVLKVVRNGKPTYRGEIVVKTDSPLQQLADLKGQRLAFVEQASASGHLYPRALLLGNGVDPDADLKEVSFAGSHDAALLALLKGNTDAACCYDDARSKLVDAGFPNIMTQTRVLAYTPEIPADNVTVIKSLPEDIAQKVVDGLLALAADEQGKQVLFDLYEIEGLVPATDADYDPVREMASVLKLDIEQEVKKGQ